MIPIKSVNAKKSLRHNRIPVKTKFGGWAWIKETDNKEYAIENYLGLVPPKKNMKPMKIFDTWFWVDGNNSTK